MKGLLVKDIYVISKYAKTYLVIFGFYAVFSFYTGDTGFLSGMTVLLAALMTITSFSYDDLAKWDKYARSLPVTKREIVLSKYLLGFVLTVAGAILSLVGTALFHLIDKNGTLLPEQLATSYALSALAVVFLCILLPLIFRFGVEKSRLMMFAVFLIPTLAVVALSKMNVQMPTEDQLMLALKVSPVILVVLVALSFLISCRIYRNRET